MAEYFYIEPAEGVSTITFRFIGYGMTLAQMPTLEYSIDKTSWNSYSWTSSTYIMGYAVKVNGGHKLYFRGINDTFSPTTATDSMHIVASSAGDRINVGGNLSSLLVGDNMTEVAGKTRCFLDLFAATDYVKVVDASNLVCDVMGNRCYWYLFYANTSLITIPQLPITTLDTSCYNGMFFGCTGIKLSTTQTGRYLKSYRIPISGTGVGESNSFANMFYGTGGTFAGTPTINTTYYTENIDPATFYIEAIEDTTITLSKVGSPTAGTCYYGIDDNTVPNAYTYGNNISLTAGQKCYFIIGASTTDFNTANYLNFTSTGNINVGGNLSDLIGQIDSIPRNHCFCSLFYQCTKLIDASNLVLCSNFNSKTYCYVFMFRECASLIVVPELSATTLTDGCYQGIFRECTSLTTPPELPATTLANYCYYSIFQGCTSLTTAPSLPATNLSERCYRSMFDGCTSLTTPPELPATNLAGDCYAFMFRFCSSLKTAPILSVTNLSERCYYYMFYGCTSLTTPPELPATTLANYCYQYMFYGCTSLTTPPELPATTLANYCYQYMFYGCILIKLSETQTENYSIPYRIPTSGTGTIGTYSLLYMFTGTGGTFTGTPTINTTYYLFDYMERPYIGTKKLKDSYVNNKKVKSMWIGSSKIYG